MASLTQAHVKQIYRMISLVFSAVVVILFGLTLILGSSSATITVTPVYQPVSTTFSLIVSPTATDKTGLVGSVTSSSVAASVSAPASTTGTDVPAHAHGPIVIHNNSQADQPLSIGTRLASTTGIIVRTASRVDVPGGGTVTVDVTADPTGDSGNLAAGRLTIVALRPANQSIIFGEVVTPLTGGTIQKSGTLALEDLTAASDQAQKKIRQQVGANEPGHLRLLVPQSVATDPEATVSSKSYTITVTMKLVEVRYPASQLDQRLQKELTAALADDQRLIKAVEPTITVGDQPAADSITLKISGQGEAAILSSSPLLQPANFVGLSRAAVMTKLSSPATIKSVVVTFSPFWRTSAPSQPQRIHLTVVPAAQ